MSARDAAPGGEGLIDMDDEAIRRLYQQWFGSTYDGLALIATGELTYRVGLVPFQAGYAAAVRARPSYRRNRHPVPLERIVALVTASRSAASVAAELGLDAGTVLSRLRRAGYAIATLRDVRCAICGARLRNAKTRTMDGRHACSPACKNQLVRRRAAERGPNAPKPRVSIRLLAPEILRLLRAGRSQRRVAAELGISRSGLYRWIEAHRP